MVLAKKLGCPVDDGGVGASKDTLKVDKCFKTSNGQFSFLIFSITFVHFCVSTSKEPLLFYLFYLICGVSGWII